MSRKCDLSGTGYMNINKVSIERSKVTRRTACRSFPNLQEVTLDDPLLGKKSLKISVRTLRTIEKYGGLSNYLAKVKRKHLTLKAKQMRKKVYSAVNQEKSK